MLITVPVNSYKSTVVNNEKMELKDMFYDKQKKTLFSINFMAKPQNIRYSK